MINNKEIINLFFEQVENILEMWYSTRTNYYQKYIKKSNRFLLGHRRKNRKEEQLYLLD